MIGCGCLFAILAGLTPRLALGLAWIFTNWVKVAFEGWFLPMLGLIFLPYTTLFYVMVYNPRGLELWGVLFVIFGFVLDIGSYSAKAYTNREKIANMENMTVTEAISTTTGGSSDTSSKEEK